jgi:hypothetical protein
MNALINACLKPTPSTLPLATNEIKKLHHWNFYLKRMPQMLSGLSLWTTNPVE